MALEGTTAQYTIAITKVGDGAAQAQQELIALQQTAASVNATTVATSTSMGKATGALMSMHGATRTASESFRALEGTLRVIGFSTMPRVTLAVSAGIDAMRALSSVAKVVGTSALVAGGALGGLALAALLYAYSIVKLRQAQDEIAKGFELESTIAHKLADEYSAALQKFIGEGHSFTDAQADMFDRLLQNPSLQKLRMLLTEMHKIVPSGFFLSDSEKSKIVGAARTDLSDLQARQDALVSNQRSKSVFPETYSRAEKEADYVRVLQRESEVIETNRQLYEAGEITFQEFDHIRFEAGTKRIQQMTALNQALTETQKIERAAAAEFSSGLATAIVDFASGAKSAKQAFSEFATSFLTDIAKMIIEMEIMKVLKTVLSFGGGGAAVSAQAFGGVTLAANGLTGVRDVSSPTYFPKFNVLAGEAGREMMTVLARPRFMEVGGLQAVVGNAGSSRLAITNADQLAGSGGGGGKIHVHLTMDQGLRADIVKEAVDGSMITVTREVQRPGRLRDAMRKASS